ncbi:MAG: hypothetical protein Q8N96_04985 [Methylovulum sp.]|jgi:hypothetical protein|nr:hypothetical protein [Methylovulum sp.]
MALKIVYPVDVKTEEERAAYRKEFFACGRKRYVLTKSSMMKTPEGRAEWARFEREMREAEEELLQAGLI